MRIALQQLTTLLIVDLPHSFGPDNTPHQGAILPSSTFSDPTLKLSSILTFPLGALLLPLNYIVRWELQQWESLASYGFILTSNIEPTSSSLWQHNELNPSQHCTSSYLQAGMGREDHILGTLKWTDFNPQEQRKQEIWLKPRPDVLTWTYSVDKITRNSLHFHSCFQCGIAWCFTHS